MDEVTFWSVTGQKLATYNLVQGTAYQNNTWVTALTPTLTVANVYFGGKLISNGAGNIVTDRLGSVGKYFPWGQEKPSATTNGTEKFTGYFRDAETNLDYADQRYHQPGMGRFLTADPYIASAGPQDPGSWNRYAYVMGNPINFRDPRGLDNCGVAFNHAGQDDSIRSGPSAAEDPGDDCGGEGGIDPGVSDGGDGGDGDSGGDDCPYNTCVNVTDTEPPLSGLVFNPPVVAPNPTTPGFLGLIWGAIRGAGGVVAVFFASTSTMGTDDTLYRPWDAKWVEENCDKIGDPVPDVGTGPYRGGQSIEQEYECTDPYGNKFTVTIHTLTTKSGKIPGGRNRPHVRPGKPKGPTPKKILP